MCLVTRTFHRPMFKAHFNNILPSTLWYSDWSCSCADQNFMWITYFSRICASPIHLIALKCINHESQIFVIFFGLLLLLLLLNFWVLAAVLLFWDVTPRGEVNSVKKHNYKYG